MAATLTGMSEAGVPDMSRTSAWVVEGAGQKEKRGAVGPPAEHPLHPPAMPLPCRGNLQQKGSPRHEVSLSVAKIQGEGR